MRVRFPIAVVASLCCTAAGAEEFNPRAPAQCLIALQVSADVLADVNGPHAPIEGEMRRRIAWQSLAAMRADDGDVEALRSRLAGDRIAALAAAEQCVRRQDAHPGFRAASFERQLAADTADEPASVLVAMSQVRHAIRGISIAGREE